MVNDPLPSVLIMNLYKRNFTRVQLINYYPVVNITVLCYSCSIYSMYL